MKARHISSLLFLLGLGLLLISIFQNLPYSNNLTGIGANINAQAPQQVGTANIVTSVILAYRGLDTLGELLILFTASIAAGMVLAYNPDELTDSVLGKQQQQPAGFILQTAADLLMPFLLITGMYIILHGHITPGGGFQGGAILAAAFFIPLLTLPGKRMDYQLGSLLEALAGISFISIGLIALFWKGQFLAPLGEPGVPGALLSAGSLPLLYLATGIKVGAELANLLARLRDA
ncbi:MnhB domain-containing protein [Candidatus Venteria ishoeyi]|uniref:Putative monovalent cation/H+ antiporter subunit B n=1 Tax=Candidatus Venteria ishoeyi TaxID=1899563 RepID=A0A1H6FE75_9GAMM|nr:MnhB domain-containing protein [Candidatus Venteria ishoeyi]MDM8547076.1 MnhB domain-containing protein [Candidatus Venteria ishoeyi]SEH07711.1 putative monovalent cation/H+ antiporter subunit B [Candidatus Venteria ishoeyi]